MNNLFQSSIPADLISTDFATAQKALEASGMKNVKLSKDVPANFGEKILVAGTPSLPVGVGFMLMHPTRVEAVDRNGRDMSYDAFVILLETGEERIVSASTFLNPWFAQEKDMTPAQLAMFEGFDKSLQTIAAFYRKNDTKSIINSPSNEFTIATSLADRIALFQSGVITTEATEQFDFKFTDKATQKESVGRQRLIAFTSKTAKKDIDAFAKNVKTARKA